MFKIFGSKPAKPAETPRSRIVIPSGGAQIPEYVAAGSKLRRRPTAHMAQDQAPRRGMWVVYQSRVGILTNLEPGDVATVMLVDDAGRNSLEIHAQAAALRQAWFEEIPEPRRPMYEDAERFGYHSKQ